MKIKKENLASYVAQQLEYSPDYSESDVSELRNDIDSTQLAFGRLIEILLPKLTDAEIDFIVNNKDLQNIKIER